MFTYRPDYRSPFAKSIHFAMVVAVLVAGLTPPAALAQSKDAQIASLQMQINTTDQRISDADREPAAVGDPNWGCGCGLMVVLAVIPGAIIWYFADVKPKEDRKHEIQAKIDRLQQEKQNLQNQMMLLQSSK